MKKLLFFWSKLKSTFWFIPVFIILIAACLAMILIFLDARLNFYTDGIGRYLFVGSVDSARSILSTISGAMIGVAGTVFSITLVALTLASSQFGSRLIRNFMYDHLNQIVLGTYISTFIYCLIVLNVIKEKGVFVFIHHVAISIQADKVIADISESLSRNLETLFTEEIGDENDDEESKLRVIADRTTYEGMLDAAFNQIRQFADGSPAVVIRLMESLITINRFARIQNHKIAIKKHA